MPRFQEGIFKIPHTCTLIAFPDVTPWVKIQELFTP